MRKCDYRGCKRDIASGGNIIFDKDGNEWNVDLCEYHLKKLGVE